MGLINKIKKLLKKLDKIRIVKGWKIGVSVVLLKKKEQFLHKKGVDNGE